jgi:prepilin-type N-terminal cleavage/methylation domain-containing protein
MAIRPRLASKRPTGAESGFTLMELLVVIALIAVIATMAVPSVSNIFKISLGSTTRDLATTVRYAYNAAMMTKKMHRLVYDLENHSYWVEVGPASVLMDTEESKARRERARRFGSKRDEDKEPDQGAFSLARYVTRKKNEMPRGVQFEDVTTEQNPEPVTRGLAYTHFFPHGIIEQTVIHLQDTANHKSTLVITPIVGRTRVIERYVPAKEAILED